MAAILNTTKSTTATKILRRARAEARLATDATGTNFVGTNSTDVNALLLDDLNEVERELMVEFPRFSLTSASLTTTASTRYVALPAGILLNQVKAVVWADSSSMDGVRVRPITEQEMENLPACYRQSDYTEDYPAWYYVRPTLQSTSVVLDFYPLPSGAKAFTLWYLTKGTTFVEADLTTAGTNYSAVPDEFYDLAALKLACRWTARSLGWGSAEAQMKRREYEERKQYVIPLISTTLDQTRNAQVSELGYPRDAVTQIQWDFSEGDY